MMKRDRYILALLAGLILISLGACSKRNRQVDLEEETIPLHCVLNLRDVGAGGEAPNDIQPTRVMIWVVNNKGIVEAQKAVHKTPINQETFTFNVTPGTKRIYAYAISPKGTEDDNSFTAMNYVDFSNFSAGPFDFDGAGVTQFNIPKFTREHQLLGFNAKIDGHTTQDANIIYSGYTEIYHSKANTSHTAGIILFPQMSRVEVRVFVEKATMDAWSAGNVAIAEMTVGALNLSKSSKFIYAKAKSNGKIDTAQFTEFTKPADGWQINIPSVTVTDPSLTTYPPSTNVEPTLVAYSAPIFSTQWNLPIENQPKVSIQMKLSTGETLSAFFPVSPGSPGGDTISGPSGADIPGKGDLYPSYNYKLYITISTTKVTIKYSLDPWDEKVIKTLPFT